VIAAESVAGMFGEARAKPSFVFKFGGIVLLKRGRESGILILFG
jgi:hypothetical protein